MENYILETKNYIVTNLGESIYEESEYCVNEYMVKVKNLDCSDILFEFEGNNLVGLMAWEQNNETPEGQKLTDFTHNIAKLIENDVIDIVKFMNRHLY